MRSLLLTKQRMKFNCIVCIFHQYLPGISGMYVAIAVAYNSGTERKALVFAHARYPDLVLLHVLPTHYVVWWRRLLWKSPASCGVLPLSVASVHEDKGLMSCINAHCLWCCLSTEPPWPSRLVTDSSLWRGGCCDALQVCLALDHVCLF